MGLLQLRYWPDVWSRIWLILKECIDSANSQKVDLEIGHILYVLKQMTLLYMEVLFERIQ